MATSILDDKDIIPNDGMVDTVLADKAQIWDKTKSHILENYQDIEYNWKYANKKSGWVLIFTQKKRTLFYFIPRSEYFRLAFIFGDKAMKEIEHTSLPKHIIDMISDATTCAAGHSCFIDVKEENDLEPILTLLRIKYDS